MAPRPSASTRVFARSERVALAGVVALSMVTPPVVRHSTFGMAAGRALNSRPPCRRPSGVLTVTRTTVPTSASVRDASVCRVDHHAIGGGCRGDGAQAVRGSQGFRGQRVAWLGVALSMVTPPVGASFTLATAAVAPELTDLRPCRARRTHIVARFDRHRLADLGFGRDRVAPLPTTTPSAFQV